MKKGSQKMCVMMELKLDTRKIKTKKGRRTNIKEQNTAGIIIQETNIRDKILWQEKVCLL